MVDWITVTAHSVCGKLFPVMDSNGLQKQNREFLVFYARSSDHRFADFGNLLSFKLNGMRWAPPPKKNESKLLLKT